ncbi:MAG: hypothetical protein ACPKPY_11035 [Nitrososphaeraceae archaeon]
MLIITCSLAILPMVFANDIYSHSLFNSAGQEVGNYYVQIATEPEIPTTGESAKILLRVSGLDGIEFSDIPVSITITKNDVKVETIPQFVVTNGHYEFDYVFPQPGNYVFHVTVQDIYDTGEDIQYVFNISTLAPFGYIFFSLISFAVATPLVIIAIIFIKNKRRNKELSKKPLK